MLSPSLRREPQGGSKAVRLPLTDPPDLLVLESVSGNQQSVFGMVVPNVRKNYSENQEQIDFAQSSGTRTLGVQNPH